MPEAQWVRIDVAAEALGVSVKHAWKIVHDDNWRTREDRHRHSIYHIDDIRASARKRANPEVPPKRPRLRVVEPLEQTPVLAHAHVYRYVHATNWWQCDCGQVHTDERMPR